MMNKILSIIILCLLITATAFAKGEGGESGSGGGSSGGSSGGNSGGSSGSGNTGGSSASGGNYSYSTVGYDAELKKILFEVENKENYKGSLSALEKYVYENPKNSNGWNLIGFVSRKLGDYENAEIYYKTGLEIEPHNDDILAYLGELYLDTGRYEMALENLKVLKDICVYNCDEKAELSQAIAKYELENNL